MTLFRKVGLFLLLGAIVCAAVAGWSLRPGQHDGWVETTGTVIDHRIARDSDGDVRAPVVRFTDGTGADQVVVSSFYSSNWDPVGATVDVRYPPDDPPKGADRERRDRVHAAVLRDLGGRAGHHRHGLHRGGARPSRQPASERTGDRRGHQRASRPARPVATGRGAERRPGWFVASPAPARRPLRRAAGTWPSAVPAGISR